ncbi:hypothetical protein LXL04_002208 [Taraxacum kok-saghyz]
MNFPIGAVFIFYLLRFKQLHHLPSPHQRRLQKRRLHPLLFLFSIPDNFLSSPPYLQKATGGRAPTATVFSVRFLRVASGFQLVRLGETPRRQRELGSEQYEYGWCSGQKLDTGEEDLRRRNRETGDQSCFPAGTPLHLRFNLGGGYSRLPPTATAGRRRPPPVLLFPLLFQEDTCGIEHVGLSVLRLEIYIAVEGLKIPISLYISNCVELLSLCITFRVIVYKFRMVAVILTKDRNLNGNDHQCHNICIYCRRHFISWLLFSLFICFHQISISARSKVMVISKGISLLLTYCSLFGANQPHDFPNKCCGVSDEQEDDGDDDQFDNDSD